MKADTARDLLLPCLASAESEVHYAVYLDIRADRDSGDLLVFGWKPIGSSNSVFPETERRAVLFTNEELADGEFVGTEPAFRLRAFAEQFVTKEQR